MRKMKIFRNFILNVERKEKRTIIIKFKIVRFRYSRSYLISRKSTFRTNKLFIRVSRMFLTFRFYYLSI